jgi:hypothetical protein
MSDDQRRVLAMFIDYPPTDRLGLQCALEYLYVINDYMRDTLAEGYFWEQKDVDLMSTMSKVLRKSAVAFIEDKVFWARLETQLAQVHPELRPR